MIHPSHAPLLFETRAGILCIGGEPATALAERVGTPFYAYDSRLIQRRIKELRDVLPSRVQIHYAVKANPFPPLLHRMAGLLDGCDVASAGELEKSLEAGFRPETISFAGPGKRDAELMAALQAGITVNVESAGELERLTRLSEKLGIRPRVALRINPDFELKGSGMRMGGGAKPFGIDAEQAPAIIRKINALDIDFQGLHIFTGSQSLNMEAIIQAQSGALDLARTLLEGAGLPVRQINIGGGLGIPYFPGENRLNINPMGDRLHHLLEDHGGWLGDAHLILELGRFLVGEAGVYVTRIVDRKVSRGETFLITDGGMHHHLALSGNLGQILRKNYPVYLAHRVGSPPEEIVNIHGPLCTPLDVLGHKVALPRAEVGDLIAVTQSGAYGLTASPVHFLGHPLPAEVLLDGEHE
ncbi:pyridoxal-dependent decarboxylase, exosortase A system-associated [Thiofaba sp. EF100]|jgi:diaminopimelate decarboxylase|uniref:pyridoxal-dependent decarboxylase, exosortase A system-associated n=1 Tax=Thiofaba sp. EF100 TaxID=3121274 RepID=UPI003221B831